MVALLTGAKYAIAWLCNLFRVHLSSNGVGGVCLCGWLCDGVSGHRMVQCDNIWCTTSINLVHSMLRSTILWGVHHGEPSDEQCCLLVSRLL